MTQKSSSGKILKGSNNKVSIILRKSLPKNWKKAAYRGELDVKGGGGGSGFYGSRILDKIGDELWIFNFQPTGLWI